MGKGTPAQGRRQHPSHMMCRRCGAHAYHKQRGECASCGFGKTAKTRRYRWAKRH